MFRGRSGIADFSGSVGINLRLSCGGGVGDRLHAGQAMAKIKMKRLRANGSTTPAIGKSRD
jgi:hypothetical protein